MNLLDTSKEQVLAAQAYYDQQIELYCRRSRQAPGKLHIYDDVEPAVRSAWLVVEALPEDLALKRQTFVEVDRAAAAECILVTNSSRYKSSDVASQLSETSKQRTANMRFTLPPQLRTVELMTSGHTNPAVFQLLTEKLIKGAMTPFVVRKESTGLIQGRLWAAVRREVLTMLSEDVASADQIDDIWKHSFANSSLGPCEAMDLDGLDTVSSIERQFAEERGLQTQGTVDFLESQFIVQGKTGRNSDQGGLYPARHQIADDVLGSVKDKDAPTLYYLDIGMESLDDPLNSGKILAGSADGHRTKVLVDKQHLPDGLDIFEDRIYWTCMGNPSKNDGTVQSCKLDGTNVRSVVAPGCVHTPKQLMVDNVNQKVYFSDREGMRTMRCELDGSRLEILVQTGDFTDPKDAEDQLKYCVGMAVDPKNGFFYWTQKGPSKGNQGRIFRAPMNMRVGETARNRTDIELLFEKLPEPIDLEVNEQWLYWTDRGELPLGNTINRVPLQDLDGPRPLSAHAYQVISRNLHEAIGLKLDARNGHLYATDFGGAVYRFNEDGTHKTKIHDGESAYTGIGLVYSD